MYEVHIEFPLKTRQECHPRAGLKLLGVGLRLCPEILGER